MTTRHRLHAAFVAIGLLAPIALAALAAPPSRLSVSPNRRFLQQADGSPFFWLGDTAWLLFSRLDRADTRRYLDDRQAKSFTVIQVVVLHTAEARAANGVPALVDNDPEHTSSDTGHRPVRSCRVSTTGITSTGWRARRRRVASTLRLCRRGDQS